MRYTVSGTLLEACVLGVLSVEPTYGYDLTQKVQSVLTVSESTLYPVLRRLLGEELLRAYDATHDGRNRRYYEITEQGTVLLSQYQDDWQQYKKQVEKLITGGQSGEQK